MSERPDPETPETEDVETDEGAEHEEAEEGLEPEEDADDESDSEEEPLSARLKRAEKTAHDKTGLAASERSRRRAAERQVTELNARIERIEAKTTEKQKDDVTELIAALRDEDDEPITDIATIKKVLKAFMVRQQADEQADGQRDAQVRTIRAVGTQMETFERDFAEDHPDYFKAATFYRTARAGELEDLGYTGNRLMKKLATELFSFTQEAIEGGRDPAEVVYNLAKKRGFASGKDAATAKLQKLQKASGTAASPRSKGADNGLSWGDVAKLKGDARDKAFAKLRARELGKT